MLYQNCILDLLGVFSANSIVDIIPSLLKILITNSYLIIYRVFYVKYINII
jgi:hypothetical protein